MVTFPGLTPPYRTIVADPPWPYSNADRLSPAADHYSLATLDDLEALPVGDLAPPRIVNTEGALLWLWTTNRFMAQAHHLAKVWGFTPLTIVTWCKTGQPGVGRIVRSNTEHCLLAVRGSVPAPAQPAMSSWYAWPRSAGTGGRRRVMGGVHSVKPAAFYDLVEQVSPGPRCELFQRQGRLNWDGWGMGVEGVLAS